MLVEKKVVSASVPEKPCEPVGASTIVPDVLFMPVAAYFSCAWQRLTDQIHIAIPHQHVGAPALREEKKTVVAQTPPPEEIEKLYKLCEKQSERMDQLERYIKERAAPPTVIFPPSAQHCPSPLSRRPLFQRGEPFLHRCDPFCEPWRECEPVERMLTKQTPRPLQNAPASAVEASTAERLMQSPRQVSPTIKQQSPTLITE